jgi:hypothetical protein
LVASDVTALQPRHDSEAGKQAVVSEAKPRLPVEAAGTPASRKRNLIIASVLIAAAIALFFDLYRARHSATTAAASRRLAVLPFQNLAHDPVSDFLGFSLADAIINRLGYVNQLTIRPSYAVQRYRNEIPDISR